MRDEREDHARTTTILVAEGDHASRAARRDALGGGAACAPAVREATDLVELANLAAGAQLVLLDCDLPGGSLADAVAVVVERAGPIPIIVFAPEDAASVHGALHAGAVSVLSRATLADDLRSTVESALAGHAALHAETVRPVIDHYSDLVERSRRSDHAVIESLAAAVEAKDSVTGRHVHAVSELAARLAELVEPTLAGSEDFRHGCMLHDVGKIGVPEHILAKPGPLTEDEWAVMRRHPETGARVIAPLGLDSTVSDLVLHHHERWDGAGYPDRLGTEDIPVGARIFSVCDALEAMTAPRPYRSALAPGAAFERIREGAGRQFDPNVVAALDDGVGSGDIELGELLVGCASG